MALTNNKYIGLGQIPTGIGALIKGWDITEEKYRDTTRLPVIDFRAMTNKCPFDCFHCFTDKNEKKLSLEEIKSIIDQLAEHKTHAIDYLGEGEPTIDKDFFEIIEYTSLKNIQPIIYSETSKKIRDKEFISRLYDSGASIVPKCDSLWNPKYQNQIVRDKTGKYFHQRNEAIEMLITQGFNKVQEDGTTRIGFDMVLSTGNAHEVEKTLRYCRESNIWIIFSFYLPAGRSGKREFNQSLILNTQQRKEIRETVKKVDGEYGFKHHLWNNFITTPCIEFMQIYGDGRVSPCPGNETIIGNIKTDSIIELEKKILTMFPRHNRQTFDGECIYRKR